MSTTLRQRGEGGGGVLYALWGSGDAIGPVAKARAPAAHVPMHFVLHTQCVISATHAAKTNKLGTNIPR